MKKSIVSMLLVFVLVFFTLQIFRTSDSSSVKYEDPIVIIGYSQLNKEKIYGSASEEKINRINDEIGKEVMKNRENIEKGERLVIKEDLKGYFNKLDIKYIDSSKDLNIKL